MSCELLVWWRRGVIPVWAVVVADVPPYTERSFLSDPLVYQWINMFRNALDPDPSLSAPLGHTT